MSDDDDLRINTLHALTKHSPSLVLEEHGHCEVPAGCGGVVLRWRDPAAGTPAVLMVASSGKVRALLDDTPIHTAHLTLPPGPHVLTIEVRDLPEGPSPVLAAIRPQQLGAPALYTSAPDPAWEVRPLSLDAPFVPAQEADDLLAATLAGEQRWWFQRVVDLGARPLSADGPAVEFRFTFTHPQAP